VVYAGVSVFGDQRRVQLSGYDEADDALATLPIIAKQFKPAAPQIECGAAFFCAGLPAGRRKDMTGAGHSQLAVNAGEKWLGSKKLQQPEGLVHLT
jgi:hypothetical protein